MQYIFDKLGFNKESSLYTYTRYKDINLLPLRINKSLHEMDISPHTIFILNNKPIILFFNEPSNLEIVFKQCWNFSESPVIIIENKMDFDIYNGYEFSFGEQGKFLLNSLDKKDFNYINLLNNDYLQKTEFTKKKNKVNKVLLENIQDARDDLIYSLVGKEIQAKRVYKKKEKYYRYEKLTDIEFKEFKEKKNLANSLIGRIIFIRYLIDRKVSIGFREPHEKLSKNDFTKILGNKNETYALFTYLKSDRGFNGDWFPIIKKGEDSSIDEEEFVTETHLLILQKLVSGYNFKNNTGSLFDIYDFSIIPIEFISNVYESFIGSEEQAENGAYYTPTFLIDYILQYTIDDYFQKNPDTYNCKILDPACGSGIFLVEALRKLILQFEKVKNRPIAPFEIKKLVTDNIYAIDKDKDAVLISIFSLYLTMLDYQIPKDIEKFKFPHLIKHDSEKEPNFFHNDFFDTEAEYNKILKDKKINFIIGNPPYGKSTIKKNSFAESYINNNKIAVGNKDIVQPFMLRVRDFSSNDTKVGYIVTSKVLYNGGATKFRKNHFLAHFKVEHILELSSVRREIFENADVPVSILFYSYNKDEDISANEIHYISIKPTPFFHKFKMLFISKSDYKKVLQSKLKDNDYLWKILVYGSYLDYGFIKRLKTEYNNIQDLIDNGVLRKQQGFKRKDNNIKKYTNTEILKGMSFIDTNKSHLQPFYISSQLDTFEYDKVAYIYKNKKTKEVDHSLYRSPMLLFTGGLNNQLKQPSAMSYKNVIFTSSVICLKSTKTTYSAQDTNTLQTINGLLYSKFFAYYMLQTASSTGIEREECDDYEKLNLPYIDTDYILPIIVELELLQKHHHENQNLLQDSRYQEKFNKLINKLDEQVLKTFSLTPKEYALVDYATNIIVPMVIQSKYDNAFHRLTFKDQRIIEYIDIFIRHYINIYELNNLHFSAEVTYSHSVIGIYFRVSKQRPENRISWKENNNIENILALSGNQTLEALFIQKDIKGFETDGFYIIKPNEYKNWHTAIGYLDFYEIDDAILKAGRERA